MNAPVICECDFDAECSGVGILYCLGCGGDQCICRCGGERDCGGCVNCHDDYDRLEYERFCDECDEAGS